MGYRPRSLILTAGPSITDREISYVTDAVENGWNENWAGYIRRFEAAFAKEIGVAYAMTTSSCTGALHLSLLALGIGPGDEVIVPDLTWVATASAVRYVGATPVFCDVAEGSWCLDVEAAEALVTPRTRAILPVHLYGHPADMPAIMALAEKHDLRVVEDAAPSVGAEVGGRRTGSFGDLAAFSFQGAKVLSTGEGGMLVTDDEALMERARILGDHGRDPNRALWNTEVGYKYKMSNLQAALGLAQLERIEELVERKRWINARFREGLAGHPGLHVTGELPGCRSIHWMTSVEIEGLDQEAREELMRELREALVDTRPVFYPLSSMPMFEGGPCPVASRVGSAAINLPSGHMRTEEEIAYVCEQLVAACRRRGLLG